MGSKHLIEGDEKASVGPEVGLALGNEVNRCILLQQKLDFLAEAVSLTQI